MSKTYQIRNNHKKIGKAKSTTAYKELVLGGAILTLVGALTITPNIEKKNNVPKENTSEITNEFVYAAYTPTYKVDYKIKAGDTLTALVYSYQTDANKVYKIIDDIVRINNLSSASAIRQGQTITLTGVPEEYLSVFGYQKSIPDEMKYDSEVSDIEVEEMLAMYDYISKNKDGIVRTEDNKSYMEAFDIFYDYITEYIEAGDYSNADQVANAFSKLEMMNNTLRYFTGLDYYNHANTYETEKIGARR